MNSLTVYGDKDELEKFIKDAKGKGEDKGRAFSMQSLLPCPKSLTETSASFWDKDQPKQWREFVDDPENSAWTEEVYAERVARHEKEGILYKKNMKEHGYASWYEWQIANWGTKWDVDLWHEEGWKFTDYYSPPFFEAHLEMIESQGSGEHFDIGKHFHAYSISYNTAWSPNEEFLTTISKNYPNLRFRHTFGEGGCDFAGDNLVKNGDSTIIVTGRYNDWAVHLGFEELDIWVDDYGHEPPPDVNTLITSPPQLSPSTNPFLEMLLGALQGNITDSEE
tara:strand:- start:21894 stop:22730 length:837 start_codon:yes stop_codon:yes gene_type:complete